MFLPVLGVQWSVNSAGWGGIIDDDGASFNWFVQLGSHCSYCKAGSGMMES